MSGWMKADLTAQANAPDAASDPSGFSTHFGSAPTGRVVYRGQDNHIYELRLEAGQEWKRADLTNQAGGPDANFATFAYVTPFNGSQAARVIYCARDAHIHELRLESGGDWKKADLSALAGSADADGRPCAYLTAFDGRSTARVVYGGKDSHIHEVRLEPGQQWAGADLTQRASAPNAAGPPWGYVTHLDGSSTARVIYRSQDGHIWELRLESDGPWKRADLTHEAGASGSAGDPVAYATKLGGSSTARVVFRSADGHIHEVRLEGGDGWKQADLTHQANAPAAAGDPFPYVTSFNGGETARVLYRGQDGHVHELRLEQGGQWKHADLTSQAGGAPAATGRSYAYVTDIGRQTARVLYRAQDSHIHELRLES
jgi:hypothetical protein